MHHTVALLQAWVGADPHPPDGDLQVSKGHRKFNRYLNLTLRGLYVTKLTKWCYYYVAQYGTSMHTPMRAHWTDKFANWNDKGSPKQNQHKFINLNQFISILNIFESRKSTSYIRQYPGTFQVLQNELIRTTPAIQRRSKLHPCNPQWLGARLSHPAQLRPVEAAPAPARPSRAINKTYAIPVKRNETSHS